jgi:putative two-component system response regulator
MHTMKQQSQRVQKLLDSVIFMVDDEPLALEVTRCHLEEAGFTNFVSTSDSLSAPALIAKTRPDVMLLDLNMPGLTGLEILERLEADNLLKNVPAIILTASNDPRMKLQALRLGATEFLTKPVNPTELVMRLRNTIAAHAYWQGCWDSGAIQAAAAYERRVP